MLIMYNHNYHLVNISFWPLLSALSVMNLLMGAIKLFNYNMNNYYYFLFIFSFIITKLIMYQWWRDIVRESSYQGLHSINVFLNMKLGMILFIISEIFFFLSFFWSFFHISLTQSIDIGMKWPPSGINTFNPFMIPLLNTIILISSGISITWGHYSLINNNFYNMKLSVLITIILGVYFSLLQAYEYLEAPFNMSDSSYGSLFFLTTGFHGIHVIIGSIFIMVSFFRIKKIHFSSMHHFGFEAAAWYWHFVDIVWLFLYISIYWWGN